MPDADPLAGQTLTMLNTLLARCWPLAKGGDAKAAREVLDILRLKLAGVEFEQKAGRWD